MECLKKKVILVDWQVNLAHPQKEWRDILELAWKKGQIAKIHVVCSYCKEIYNEKYSKNLEDDGMLSHGACEPCFKAEMRAMGFSEEEITISLKENPYANKD